MNVSKLRKLVLFRVLERHGENVCFRCGLLIETVDDLTMDHILKRREHPDRCYDPENIAFSHFRCNSREGGLTTGPRLGKGKVA